MGFNIPTLLFLVLFVDVVAYFFTPDMKSFAIALIASAITLGASPIIWLFYGSQIKDTAIEVMEKIKKKLGNGDK